MSTITRKQPKTSTKLSLRELSRQVAAARKRNAKLAEENKLPSLTKSWSAKNVTALQNALGKG